MNEQTKEEWREFGFFYDYDEKNSCWRLVGSRKGLLKFCDILNEYANDERNAPLSEHEHCGTILVFETSDLGKSHYYRGCNLRNA